MYRPNHDTYYLSLAEETWAREQVRRQEFREQDRRSWDATAYRFRMGQIPITLNNVEYRILMFLAARPYHAYTRRHIVDAVSTATQPVIEQTLDRHIASLRRKLGLFHDYIQTVPSIGYRFKA
jgi:DNA-binding response OmpR family regulator